MIVSEKRVVTWKQDGKRGRGDGRKNQISAQNGIEDF